MTQDQRSLVRETSTPVENTVEILATTYPGSRILSGTEIPVSSIGRLGDFYVRITSGSFYGPKTPSGWGAALELVGPQGEPGPSGLLVIQHGSVASTERPDVDGAVYWIGSVQPSNAEVYDLWYDTSV